MSLSRSDILRHDDDSLKKVKIKELGNKEIHVKKLSSENWAKIMKIGNADDSQLDVMCHYILYCVCDEKGHNLFNKEDLPALKKKGFFLINELAQACSSHFVDGLNQIEEAAKN